MPKKVLVIGGGPAGMMAAGVAAKNGNEVILIEKNKVLGKKLAITGKGRCNITNSADIEDFFSAVPTNTKFLYSSFYGFTNEMLISFFNSLGVETKIERGGRVFPASDKAKDIVSAMVSYLSKSGVKVLKETVIDIITNDNEVIGVKLSNGNIMSDKIILATGGASYKVTGSTGDGYKFAEKCGHKIVPLKPSLVPLEIREQWVRDLQGLSLKNVSVILSDEKRKEIYSDFGEMLFTHYGVSGPIILSTSSHIRDIEKNSYTITLDLKPALSIQQLDSRISRDFEKSPSRHFCNSLDDLMPKSMVPIIVELSGINPHLPVNQMTKEMRLSVATLMKSLSFSVKKFRPLDEAIITSGGICVKEINSSTMESRLMKNLYFAGEIIDVDAYTGGYNLQIAFSTGYLAGMSV